MQNDFSQKGLPAIGVDVGGTKTSAGWVENNKLIKSYTLPTPANEGKEQVLNTILKAIKTVSMGKFSGIGVGIPGLVDTKNGVVYDVQNIPSLTSMALKSELETVFHCPVEINNDANCFALGAKHFGDGQQFNNLVGLTLGTGLGGGLILNGKLYEGVGTGAGELGFLPYKDGILEDYCSGQFFQRQYGITGKEASGRARNGNSEALEMFIQYGRHLGEAIKMIVHTFAPEAVMLGGSVSANFKLFEKSMWEVIRDFPYEHVVDNLTVKPATAPEIALVGAASLVSGKR
jgi:glucokinase